MVLFLSGCSCRSAYGFGFCHTSIGKRAHVARHRCKPLGSDPPKPLPSHIRVQKSDVSYTGPTSIKDGREEY